MALQEALLWAPWGLPRGELRRACGGPGPETGPPGARGQMSVSPCVLDMYVQGHDVQGPRGPGARGTSEAQRLVLLPFPRLLADLCLSSSRADGWTRV